MNHARRRAEIFGVGDAEIEQKLDEGLFPLELDFLSLEVAPIIARYALFFSTGSALPPSAMTFTSFMTKR